MPRSNREHSPDTVLHLISRGVERRDIFTTDGDRRCFLASMRHHFRASGVRLIAYCLMGNHFHLLAAPSAIPIGIPMHGLLTRYATYFNRRNSRSGHLFQNRFHSIECVDLAYFVELVTYIHCNPVRARMVSSPAQWPWSSHSELLNGDGQFLELTGLPNLVGMEADELKVHYRDRIAAPEPRRQLGALVRQAAAFVGVPYDLLVSGGKGESFTYARRLVLAWALEEGYTCYALARELNCSESALHQLKSVLKLGACPPA